MTTGMHRHYTYTWQRCRECGRPSDGASEYCEECGPGHDDHLSECDCCGEKKLDCQHVWVDTVGDTWACPKCRGEPDPDRLLEEKRDRELDARINRIYDQDNED